MKRELCEHIVSRPGLAGLPLREAAQTATARCLPRRVRGGGYEFQVWCQNNAAAGQLSVWTDVNPAAQVVPLIRQAVQVLTFRAYRQGAHASSRLRIRQEGDLLISPTSVDQELHRRRTRRY